MTTLKTAVWQTNGWLPQSKKCTEYCHDDCWILSWQQWIKVCRPLPKPTFDWCKCYNLSKNNLGEIQISKGLDRAFPSLFRYSKNPQLRTCEAKIWHWDRPPLYYNLFSLKFETSCHFLKSKKIFYYWANKISQHLGSSLETQLPYHSKNALRTYIRT